MPTQIKGKIKMDKDEIKATLKDLVSNFIKDEPDAAKQNFHDALNAKMRDRVNPPHVESLHVKKPKPPLKLKLKQKLPLKLPLKLLQPQKTLKDIKCL
jgi:hypothetical protein